MSRYLLILRTFLRVKFIFKNPPKHDLVIFDDESLSVLENFISRYDFFVLQVRIGKINKIYCTFKIFKLFFINYKGNIMTAYLLSLLEIIKPKVVLTIIDNSFKFSEIAKILEKKITFVAIQGAARHNILQFKHKFKKNLTKLQVVRIYVYINCCLISKVTR